MAVVHAVINTCGRRFPSRPHSLRVLPALQHRMACRERTPALSRLFRDHTLGTAHYGMAQGVAQERTMSNATVRSVWFRTRDDDLRVDRTRVIGYRAVERDAWAGPFRKTWQQAREDARERNQETRAA